jgi:radical SAM superfamily enzyme YgiQ (UPF0313 family)
MTAPRFFSSDSLPERVTLVIPPSIFLLDQRVFISLGILRVASVLENAGIVVELVDLSGVDNFLDAMHDHLRASSSKHLGITVTTPQLPLVVKIIKLIRKERPDIRIILGGPHITLTLSAVKLERKTGRKGRAHDAFGHLATLADVLVAGDGEMAVFEALHQHPQKVVDGDEPNLGYFMTNTFYEQTSYPARHLVDVSSYSYEIEGHRATSLIAQLGCPFNCGFCGGRNSKSLRKIRTRSSQNIINEVKMLYEAYGFTGFMFYDDELNLNKNIMELMDGLSRLQDLLGVEFRFRGFVKSELFTDEQAKAMYRAGFRWLLSGFESGSSRILVNINKKASLTDNTRTVENCKRNNLKIKALMSIGHPGESEKTVRDTQEWLLRVRPEDFDCTIITTYPGTPYYDEALPHTSIPNVWTYTFAKTGDRIHAYEVNFLDTADYYKGDPNGSYRSFVFTDFLQAAEIVRLREWVEESVRSTLQIPYPKARAALLYDHSTGQGMNKLLPAHILRSTELKAA